LRRAVSPPAAKPLSIPPSPRREAAAGRGAGGRGNPIASPKELGENQIAHNVHWYEAHGIGRKDFKIKRLIR